MLAVGERGGVAVVEALLAEGGDDRVELPVLAEGMKAIDGIQAGLPEQRSADPAAQEARPMMFGAHA